MTSAEDRLFILEAIASYFFAIDDLNSVPALTRHFEEGAVWECFNFGEDKPRLRFESVSQLQALAAAEMTQGAAARLRHHLTGTVFEQLAADRVRTVSKVLVTAQPDPQESPAVRNCARVTSEWRKSAGAWRITHWEIRRDSAR